MSAILECRGLSKHFGGAVALDSVDLRIEPGKVVGLLGPNGSGKTTLIKLANGLLTPTAGQILIAGRKPGPETAAVVSYLPDRLSLPEWMNVRQLMDYYADFFADFEREKAEEMLARLNISAQMRLKQMSKGTKEKVQLILVMSRKASLYLLDEPIGGVDPATRDYILDTIIKNYNKDATVILSTHLIADIEPVLDEFVFIRKGDMIRHSTVASVVEQGETVDSLFREVFRC